MHKRTPLRSILRLFHQARIDRNQLSFMENLMPPKTLFHIVNVRGYHFDLPQDGICTVTNPEGHEYHCNLSLGTCDCPDFTYRTGSHNGRCKHLYWVNQLTPCHRCPSVMLLRIDKRYFDCLEPQCQFCLDARIVQKQRNQRRNHAASL